MAPAWSSLGRNTGGSNDERPTVTDDQTHYDLLLAASHVAVMQFGAGRVAALMRTTIWHLRRIPASGIWGDDYAYRTLSDEECDKVRMVAELRPPSNPAPT